MHISECLHMYIYHQPLLTVFNVHRVSETRVYCIIIAKINCITTLQGRFTRLLI